MSKRLFKHIMLMIDNIGVTSKCFWDVVTFISCPSNLSTVNDLGKLYNLQIVNQLIVIGEFHKLVFTSLCFI